MQHAHLCLFQNQNLLCACLEGKAKSREQKTFSRQPIQRRIWSQSLQKTWMHGQDQQSWCTDLTFSDCEKDEDSKMLFSGADCIIQSTHKTSFITWCSCLDSKNIQCAWFWMIQFYGKTSKTIHPSISITSMDNKLDSKAFFWAFEWAVAHLTQVSKSTMKLNSSADSTKHQLTTKVDPEPGFGQEWKDCHWGWDQCNLWLCFGAWKCVFGNISITSAPNESFLSLHKHLMCIEKVWKSSNMITNFHPSECHHSCKNCPPN